MSTALQNHILSIIAPKGVIPDLSSPRADLVKIADFLNSLAGGMGQGKPGESRVTLSRGSTDAAYSHAFGTIALASCAALTGVKVNGVAFTALATGTPTVAFNEFVISGTDAADATSLAAAINASTSAGVAGVVTAANLAGTVTLVSVVAGDFVTIDGVRLTATESASDRLDSFTMSGTDTADAAALVVTINAHPYLRTKVLATSSSGVVTLRMKTGTTTLDISSSSTTIAILQATGTITFATPIAGTTVVIGGITFTGKTGASGTSNPLNFSVDTSDTAAGDDLVTQVAAHSSLSTVVTLTNAAGTVTVSAKTTAGSAGNGITLAGTVTVAAASAAALSGGGFAAVSTVMVTAKQAGVLGNGIKLEAMGIQASTTATCVSVVITDTLVVNGQTFTAIKQRATGTITAASAIAGDTCVVNGVTFTGVAGATGVGKPVSFSIDSSDTATATDLAAQINAHPTVSLVVSATSSVGVVTVRAIAAGTAGNSIVMAGTATRLAFVGGTLLLSGGIAVANNQFDVSPGGTNTQVAADIVRAINASTTTLVSSYVRATNLLGVVTVYSQLSGTIGNSITLSSTGGTITCAAARLAGATTATTDGAQASATLTLTSWLNTETVAVNGVTITAHTNTQANNQVDISGSDTADAANLALAINNSTTAALAEVIATSAAAVVTVKSRKGGIVGNLITLSSGQASVVASAARLATGAVPLTVVVSGPQLTGGVGGDAATVYAFSG